MLRFSSFSSFLYVAALCLMASGSFADIQLQPLPLSEKGSVKEVASGPREEVTYIIKQTPESLQKSASLEEAERRPSTGDVVDSAAHEKGQVFSQPSPSRAMNCSGGWVKLVLILLGITGVLLIILLPISFGDLEYYEVNSHVFYNDYSIVQ